MNDLKNCKFCGEEAKIIFVPKEGFVPACTNGRCWHSIQGMGFKTRAEAVDAWNTDFRYYADTMMYEEDTAFQNYVLRPLKIFLMYLVRNVRKFFKRQIKAFRTWREKIKQKKRIKKKLWGTREDRQLRKRAALYVPCTCFHCELLGICRDEQNEWKCRHGCIILNEKRRNEMNK